MTPLAAVSGRALAAVAVLVAITGAAGAGAPGDRALGSFTVWVTACAAVGAIVAAMSSLQVGSRLAQRTARRSQPSTHGGAPPARDARGPGAAARTAVVSRPDRVAVVHVMADGESLTPLDGESDYLSARGFTVTVVSAVPSPRRPGISDAIAVLRMWRALASAHATVVHVHGPAGGLVGMLAAWLARAPVRFYQLRTLPLLEATGPRRVLLWVTEWLACTLAHRVLAPTLSLRSAVIAEGLCPTARVEVLADVGGDGVDATTRFRPLPPDVRRATRAHLGIPEDALVLGFVGALPRDEGLADLGAAFRRLRESDPRLHLLVLATDGSSDRFAAALRGEPRVHVARARPDRATQYAAMDVVALPAPRDGCPRIALEAAAMSLPTVVTRVPGHVEAVVDRRTGLLVPPRDPAQLAQALARYLADPVLRAAHGEAARRRVIAAYQPERIWGALATAYGSALQARRANTVHARGSKP